MAGPPPTPTNILAIRGSWRASSRVKAGEPAGTPLDRDDPPSDVPESHWQYWEELVPAARSMNVMTLADVPAMKQLCELCFIRDLARNDMTEHGIYTHGENGGEYQRPCVGLYNQTVLKINAMLQQFGMTPASRARVRAAVPPAAGTNAPAKRRVVS